MLCLQKEFHISAQVQSRFVKMFGKICWQKKVFRQREQERGREADVSCPITAFRYAITCNKSFITLHLDRKQSILCINVLNIVISVKRHTAGKAAQSTFLNYSIIDDKNRLLYLEHEEIGAGLLSRCAHYIEKVRRQNKRDPLLSYSQKALVVSKDVSKVNVEQIT